MFNVYCLPCAGGSATIYLRWRQHLPSWINIVPIELAGRGERISESPFTDFKTQIEDIYSRFFTNHASSNNQPYILFGHSMGAKLGYQLIQKMCIEQYPLPKALLVSASSAPSCYDPKRFAEISDEYLIKDLKQHNGTPDAVFEHPELLDMILQVLKSDYQVCASDIAYEGSPLPIPIHAFAGKEDSIAIEDVEAWRTHSQKLFTLDVFAGGHFYLKRDDSERTMLKRFTEIMTFYR